VAKFQVTRFSFPLNLIKLDKNERLQCAKIISGTGGLIARHINKKISLPISIYLHRCQVTPNQITLFNLLLGLLAGLVAACGGDYWNVCIAGILFQLASIFDGCDGEVAKLGDKSTRFGAWFDTLGDNLSFVLFITGVAYGLFLKTQAVWIVDLAKLSLVSFAVLLSIMISYLVKQKSSAASLVTYEKEVVSTKKLKNPIIAKLLYYGKFLVKKDFFAFLFCLLAMTGFAEAIVVLAALGTTAVALVLSFITIKSSKAKKAIVDKSLEPVQ
jgi:phosphatidylglycerophosphate synthase